MAVSKSQNIGSSLSSRRSRMSNSLFTLSASFVSACLQQSQILLRGLSWILVSRLSSQQSPNDLCYLHTIVRRIVRSRCTCRLHAERRRGTDRRLRWTLRRRRPACNRKYKLHVDHKKYAQNKHTHSQRILPSSFSISTALQLQPIKRSALRQTSCCWLLA